MKDCIVCEYNGEPCTAHEDMPELEPTPLVADLPWYRRGAHKTNLRNLLAVLCGDGGHYRAAHGTREAIKWGLQRFRDMAARVIVAEAKLKLQPAHGPEYYVDLGRRQGALAAVRFMTRLHGFDGVGTADFQLGVMLDQVRAAISNDLDWAISRLPKENA